ncbi:hypothetical protein WJX73_001245 [Symbiochloris irregularis]|uniref:SURP and G-patch domain-containing protein 1-like protein n=1 Tax=Symbiochloris irregularis TaxID=706552 RepID=A0AAW1PKE9_9CHLO
MEPGVSLRLGAGVKRPQQTAFGKVPRVAAFAADSDDDDEAPNTGAKRRRSTEAEAAKADLGPSDEVKKVADKLAEFVAKNGRSFEDVTRSRNTPDGPFKFLYNKSSADYLYYDRKVQELTQKHSSNTTALPPIPPPPSAPAPPQTHQPSNAPSARPYEQRTGTVPAAASSDSRGMTEQQQAAKQALAAGGDSVAAMEAFAAAAKRQEETREEREMRIEHLNETSFDRRRKVAVYKSDGRKGHHMQDFIPPEELAALLNKSGDAKAAAQAAALTKSAQLGTDNVGHKLLSQMGWKEGEGLGRNAAGIAAPLSAVGMATEKRGLGAKSRGDVEEGDDEFEVYRKRMMLGYKHRPNPLGNPRKQYDS